jgi:rpsU-divergently transcribed protein
MLFAARLRPQASTLQLSRMLSPCVLSRGFCASTASPSSSQSSQRRTNPPRQSEVDVLVDAVLLQVKQHGWTDVSVAAAVSDLGWSPAAAALLPRGPASAVEVVVGRFNRDLAVRLADADEAGSKATGSEFKSTRDRTAFAIQTRIEMAAPYRHSWSQALALQALPQSLSSSALASARLADEIAHYAGYRTPDVWQSIRH